MLLWKITDFVCYGIYLSVSFLAVEQRCIYCIVFGQNACTYYDMLIPFCDRFSEEICLVWKPLAGASVVGEKAQCKKIVIPSLQWLLKMYCTVVGIYSSLDVVVTQFILLIRRWQSWLNLNPNWTR